MDQKLCPMAVAMMAIGATASRNMRAYHPASCREKNATIMSVFTETLRVFARDTAVDTPACRQLRLNVAASLERLVRASRRQRSAALTAKTPMLTHVDRISAPIRPTAPSLRTRPGLQTQRSKFLG